MSVCYDVAVVGGGVTGLATALALAQQTALQVVLLESRAEPPRWELGVNDSRVSALSRESVCLFERLQVWDSIVAREVSPFQRMQVWNADGAGEVHFDASDLDVSALGYIVANRLLEASLSEGLQRAANIKVMYATTPSKLTFDDACVRIQTQEGVQYRARLVVGADGADSRMREAAGFDQTVRDYGHVALVAVVETECPHNETARQIFLPTGPLAFLPLSSPHMCSIVWSVVPEEASRLQALSDSDFSAALASAFQFRAGCITNVFGRRAFPLLMRHAKQYVCARFALVGDAAHTIHPLAGQGMNLGLQDAALLVKTVVEAVEKGQDFSAKHILRRYERARKTDNYTMLAIMDFFKTVPAHSNPLVRRIWRMGMSGVNRSDWIKKCVMNFALGRAPLLPAAASGDES